MIINNDNFQEVLAKGLPVVVDFGATWCGPCKVVGRVLDELEPQYEGRVIIGKCDIDESEDLAMQFGIRNVPTVIFFKDGQPVDKNVGAAPKPTFIQKIDALL